MADQHKKLSKDNIWSDEKIKSEALYAGILWGTIGFVFANFFGKKVLGFSSRMNLASSVITMMGSGILYRGIYYQDLMNKRNQLLLEDQQE